MAKEPCKVQLHLSVAEETYDGFSLLPDRCFFKGLLIGTLLWKTFLTTCNDTCIYAKGEKLGVAT